MKKLQFYELFIAMKRRKKMFLIMWNFFILFFVLNLTVTANALSQKTVSLDLKDVTLKKCIRTIEQQTGMGFLYNGEELRQIRGVTINVTNKKVDEVLEEILKNSGYTYRIQDEVILVKKSELPKDFVQSKKLTVKGKVTDSSGAPLPGVTVMIVGSTSGVITDPDGMYEFAVEPNAKLHFSFIGMTSQEIEVNGRNTINVVLQDKSEELADVTVVAFGKQKKESVLASISTVDVSELKVPSSNLTTAMAGRMSGIISYQRSGEPGQDNAEFFVRGVTTFGYSKSPLILIDGVETTTTDLARLQPDDVASFSIMKDATATALYGARGANGVIYVTTKEGKEGKAKISIRFEESISTPVEDVELADPITYMKLHNEAVRTRDPLGILPYSESKVDNTIAGGNPYLYPATNWYKELFKDHTLNSRMNFNVSGGGKIARYYVAGTYNVDKGVLNVDKRNNFNSNINLKKIQLRSNVNVNITKTTEAVIRFNTSFDDYTGPIDGGSGLYNKVMRTNPVLFPAYYEADEAHKFTKHILFGNYGAGKYINPYADMVKGYKDYSVSKIVAQAEIKQDLNSITDGLMFKVMGNTSRYSYFDVSRYYNPYYYQPKMVNLSDEPYQLEAINPKGGTEYLNYEEGEKKVSSSFYGEASLNYNRTFNELHSISGLIIGTLRQSLVGNAGDLQKSLAYRNMGLSGRFTYSYDKRYFGEFNFGYNGSERFSKSHRFGFFPSMGLGWIVSNEKFWSGSASKIITKLKLKGTYGLVGNDAIGSADDRFFYLSKVNMNKGGASFGERFEYSRSGVSIDRYENEDITWEEAEKINLGVELTLMDKFNLFVDVFRENRSNILMNRTYIPVEMGLEASVRANVGEAYSEGIDLSLDYQNYFNQDTWLSVRGNFTYAVGKFRAYEEPDFSEAPWLSKINRPISQTWGYVAERLFIDDNEVRNSPTQFGEYEAGDIKYKDVNNDGVINFKDQVPIGYPTSPEIIYGFGFSFGKKNLDISCFFQGSARSSFWIDPVATAPFIDTDGSGAVATNNALLKVYAEDVWTEDNQNPYALWPRLSDYVNENNKQKSTWFMRDGSFLRLKSLEVGYSLPKSIITRIGAQKVRIYGSGTNLLTFSKFKLWDPEMGSNGLGYPIQRVYNLGIQLSF